MFKKYIQILFLNISIISIIKNNNNNAQLLEYKKNYF